MGFLGFPRVPAKVLCRGSGLRAFGVSGVGFKAQVSWGGDSRVVRVSGLGSKAQGCIEAFIGQRDLVAEQVTLASRGLFDPAITEKVSLLG